MTATRTWYGFHPAVVVLTVAVLIVGGFIFARPHADRLDQAVKQSCADAVAYKHALGTPAGANKDIFGTMIDVANIQVKALSAVPPLTGEREALRQQLLSAEQSVLTQATQGEAMIAPYTSRGDYADVSRTGFESIFKPAYAQAKANDALFAQHFGIKHCAD